MSWVALAHAWSISLCPRDKLVLLALADHANDEDFTCFPSVRHLCLKTNMCRATVFKALESLEDLGLIKRTNRKVSNVVQMSNLYELTYAKTLQVSGSLEGSSK